MSKIYSSAEFNTRDPSQNEVRRLFRYDAATSDLIWRNRPRSDFATDRGWKIFNTQFADKIAGNVKKRDGYRYIGINGKLYLAHRLIWILHNGTIPADMSIDHIDGDRSDNRINNLRLATHAENMRNSRKRVDNQSGVKGVTFHKANGKYQAGIRVNGKQIHLGYGTIEECAALYEEAANKYHGDFARIA